MEMDIPELVNERGDGEDLRGNARVYLSVIGLLPHGLRDPRR